MSELQSWSPSTAAQVHARLTSLSRRVGHRVHDFRGDDLESVRSLLLAIVGELDETAQGLVAQASVEGVRRQPGETRCDVSRVDAGGWDLSSRTDPHVQRMRANRGPR